VGAGFWRELVVPSPKLHGHEVGEPVLVSVNETGRGATPVFMLVVNEATGALTVVGGVVGTELLPPPPHAAHRLKRKTAARAEKDFFMVPPKISRNDMVPGTPMTQISLSPLFSQSVLLTNRALR